MPGVGGAYEENPVCAIGGTMSIEASSSPRVGLFVTCLVDALRPQVGFAALALLEAAGCQVHIPRAQTCCGQPGLNSGDRTGGTCIAQSVIGLFEEFDAVVAPSGSCASTLRNQYPGLFPPGSDWHRRALALAGKTYELLSYLTDVRGWRPQGISWGCKATYHDSCSGLRELGVKTQPRRLLAAIDGLQLVEMEEAESCCGFGGTFCVKYADVSNAIVSRKTDCIAAAGAQVLLGGDLGCLMNMAGRLHREGRQVRAFHAAEVLAGRGHEPAIGEES